MPHRRPLVLCAFALLLLSLSCQSNGGDGGVPQVNVTVTAGAPDIAATATPGAGTTPPPSGTAGPATTPTTTAGAALTPKPGAPTDIAEARRLEHEGELEAAASAYLASAAANPANRSEGTLGAARVLLELEKPSDVRLLLEPFVQSATGRDIAARYLLARAYAALSMWQQSVEQYDAYIAAGRPALPYAHLDRARGLAELNRATDAIAALNTGLNLGVPGGIKRSFLVSIAQNYERAGNLPEAIRAYNAVIEGSDLPGDDALALSRISAIKRTQNNPTYVDELKRLLASYPSTTQALNDLEDALKRNEPIDPVIRGIVYYRNNDYTKAEAPLREQISLSPNAQASAEAYYFLAAILENKGDNAGALTNYENATRTNPQSTIADDALWWRARILEDSGKADEARPLFARIASEYPNSTWAADAAFRRGMLQYRAGKHTEAAAIFAELLPTAPADEKQRLTFWQGKALLKAGNPNAARPILEALARDGEDDYYGIRAESILRGKHDEPKAARESKVELTQGLDFAAAESWLATRTGSAIAEGAWAADHRWLRAQELWLVGRSSQGDSEAFDVIETYARDSVAMYTMARNLAAQGRIGMSGRAGQRLLRTLNTNPNAGLPKAIMSLSYPPAFGSSAAKHSQANSISPLLLLAFIRQESFFDPRAESPVGALGLTQVMPATAKQMGGKSGLPANVTDEELLHADLNLRFGANYMSQQLKDFESEIFVAFAAYNAGPNAAKRWRKAAGQDADVFLEMIEFKESRLYVEIVSENYAIYRYLYAGEKVPNLPD